MGITETLARYVVETEYKQIPEEARRVAKQVVLDGLANMLAGSREPLASVLLQYLKKIGGPETSTIIGHNLRSSLLNAAFANGIFCHCMDFEMMWYPPTHPTSPTLSPALSLGEWLNLSGSDLIAALVLGFEVQGRLRLASPLGHAGFHPPGTVGVMGSAATCAKLLNLDVQRTRWALGIAGSRAGAITANIGTMTKSSHCGNAARMGLEAALMAAEGWTANEDIIEAEDGFGAVLFPPGAFKFDLVVKDFGRPYRMVSPGLSIKMFPAQYPTHWPIVASLEVRREHGLDPKEIERVEVITGDQIATRKLRPKTGLEGKFSIPYVVSAALLDGKVVIDTFTDARRFAPDIEQMLGKVHIILDPSIDPYDFATAWCQVTVRLKDGTSYSARCDKPPGHFMRPISLEEHEVKFRECAKRVLEEPAVDHVLEVVRSLEHLQDVASLLQMLRVG